MRLGIKFPAMSLSLLLSTKTCLKLAHIHSVKEFSDNLLIYILKKNLDWFVRENSWLTMDAVGQFRGRRRSLDLNDRWVILTGEGVRVRPLAESLAFSISGDEFLADFPFRQHILYPHLHSFVHHLTETDKGT